MASARQVPSISTREIRLVARIQLEATETSPKKSKIECLG